MDPALKRLNITVLSTQASLYVHFVHEIGCFEDSYTHSLSLASSPSCRDLDCGALALELPCAETRDSSEDGSWAKEKLHLEGFQPKQDCLPASAWLQVPLLTHNSLQHRLGGSRTKERCTAWPPGLLSASLPAKGHHSFLTKHIIWPPVIRLACKPGPPEVAVQPSSQMYACNCWGASCLLFCSRAVAILVH